MASRILLINGPNLNLLGLREPGLYGSERLADIETAAKAQAASASASLGVFQSNSEGEIIDRIHAARGEYDAILINAAGLTHTSVVLRDALLASDIPFVEIHITNTHTRETFRHHSFLSDKAVAVIMGLGTFGYKCAIDFAIQSPKFARR